LEKILLTTIKRPIRFQLRQGFHDKPIRQRLLSMFPVKRIILLQHTGTNMRKKPNNRHEFHAGNIKV